MKKEPNEKHLRLSKHEKKLKEFHEKMEYENLASNYNRARSISVGTAFGGTTEIMVRGDGGRHLWLTMQPVEVIELIHQLSSNVGCHLALKPREDFSSWRDWKITDQEKLHFNGWAPFVNDMAPVQQIGANMQNYEKIKQQEKELLLLQNEIQVLNNDDFLKIKIDSENLTLDEKIDYYRTKINETRNKLHGEGNLNFDENNILKNEVVIKENGVMILGGKGGHVPDEEIKITNKIINETRQLVDIKNNNDETLATEKTVYKRKPKRSSASS